jgi:hypothetical protein
MARYRSWQSEGESGQKQKSSHYVRHWWDTHSIESRKYWTCPAVSQTDAFKRRLLIWRTRAANSTPEDEKRQLSEFVVRQEFWSQDNDKPMVLFMLGLNSFLVNRHRRLLLPTPLSPTRTWTENEIKANSKWEWKRSMKTWQLIPYKFERIICSRIGSPTHGSPE